MPFRFYVHVAVTEAGLSPACPPFPRKGAAVGNFDSGKYQERRGETLRVNVPNGAAAAAGGNGHEHPWAETLKRGSADKRLLVGA